MTVNPAAASSAHDLRSTPGTRYEFAIDNDGDYMEDAVLKLRADRPQKSGRQRVQLYWQDVDAGTSVASAPV